MKKKKFQIDFLGIGVEKAGSTWLGKCISEHPEICFSKGREIYFFNDVDAHFLSHINTKYSRGIVWYEKQFSHCPVDSKKGEWAITYICTEKTAARIKKHYPQVKLMVCLRNPIERAFSQYLYEIRLGIVKKTESFEETLKKRPDYIEKGFYAQQLIYYYKHFKKDQILVLIYARLKKHPEYYIKKVWNFLELKDRKYLPPSLKKKVNKSGEAVLPQLNLVMLKFEYFMRSHGMDFILKILETLGIRRLALKIRDVNNKSFTSYPQMSDKVREKLENIYKDDVKKLERLLKINLSIWKIT